jgi:hypothetical protein
LFPVTSVMKMLKEFVDLAPGSNVIKLFKAVIDKSSR